MSDTDTPPLADTALSSTGNRVGSSVYGLVVADDDDNVRQALAGLLGDHQGFWLAGEATSGTEAAEICASLQPHAALIDVMMPTGGCQAATAILAVSPRTVIAAYTARADRRTHDELVGCGVAQVFVKGRGDDLAASLYQLVRERHQP